MKLFHIKKSPLLLHKGDFFLSDLKIGPIFTSLFLYCSYLFLPYSSASPL